MSIKLDPHLVSAFKDDAIEILNDMESALLKVTTIKPDDFYDRLMRAAHNLKGNAGLIGFNDLKDFVHKFEGQLQVLKKNNSDPTSIELKTLLFETEKYLKSWITNLAKNNYYKPSEANIISKIDAWISSGQIKAPGNSSTEDRVEALIESGQEVNETVRIPAAKLDSLIQLVGELSLNQAIVMRGKAEGSLDSNEVNEALNLTDKIVSSLRASVLDLRMLPMEVLYRRLERAGMELSLQLKKPFHFLTEGVDVSVDKAVLNRIFDPLLHILRNAMDHGIEDTDERKKCQKSPNGTIMISTHVVPSGILISIKDDGRGLNLKKIKNRAIEKGIIKETDIIAESEIKNLIFHPGFSTVDTVTDISGRGVGLDVVLKEVNSLGGTIEVFNKPGAGTEFQITLPANISLIEAFIVKSQNKLYAIPTQEVLEVLDASEFKFEKSAIFESMIKLRDKVVPVEPLGRFMPTEKNHPVNFQTGSILIVSHHEQQMGLHIEHIEGQQQLFVRPLKGFLATLPRLTGSTILSNGEPSLIINLKEIASEYFNNTLKGSRLGEHSI